MPALKLDNAAKYGMHPQLFATIKALAVDNARTKLEIIGVPDLTDNSTGTAGTLFADPVIPASAFDATAAGGAQLAATNTALGKFEDAGKVLVNSINNARARIGLAVMTSAVGTQASANVIPAQDLTVATANGATAVDFATARTAMTAAKANLGRLFAGFNELRAGLGMGPISQAAFRGDTDANRALVDVPTITASATGASSVSKVSMDAFLGVLANNIATIAKYWGLMFTQGAFSSITDSSGGAAAAGLVANTIPAAVAGAATTSSPKAGFDAQLVILANAIAEIGSKMNQVRGFYDLSLYVDNTGSVTNGTIEAISNNLTAVDGSTGTVAVDQATGRNRLQLVNNALSSLAVGVNDLVGYVGVPSLTDASGGVVSTTLPVIAATGGGVGGATAVTLLDTDVDTWLGNTRNNISSLAATLNSVCANSNSGLKPLGVVAG